VLVRRANAADAPALTALTQASGAYRGEHRAILEGLEISAEQVARDECHLVEDDHGGIVGYYSLIVSGEDAELDLMFVADHVQGGGLGALLFRHMASVAKARGARRVRIVSHPPAEAFYLRMGAQRVGLKPPDGRVDWARPVLELAL
jgi:GNAT superfamily N-acetyltransferase